MERGVWLRVCCGLLSLVALAGASLPAAQTAALKALYDSTNGPGWRWKGGGGVAWSFANDSDPCTAGWHGVVCSGGDVKVLALNSSRLAGTIPSEIALFTGLKILALHSNSLTEMNSNKLVGRIPSSLNLLLLQQLTLQGNLLTGFIPPTLSLCTNLKRFTAQNNLLRGPVPAALGLLTNLEYLNVYNNFLTSTVPPELSRLLLLKYLSLSYNSITGPIPEAFSALTSLTSLYLSNSFLTGRIPSSFGQLSLLKLDLSNNFLTGTIPTELCNLSRLDGLWLSFNRLRSSIPSVFGNLLALQTLALQSNSLTGTIPPQLGNLRLLKKLSMGTNRLVGPIPASFGQLVALQNLYFQKNRLTRIPDSLSALARLEILDLSNNQISQEFPSWLGMLTKLQVVWMYSLRLYGNIPTSVGLLQRLFTLDFHSNNVSGPIPETLGQLSMLFELDLSDNHLTGAIPSSIGELYSLQSLDLSNNHLSSTLPTSMAQLADSLMTLNASNNAFRGNIPSVFDRMTSLVVIDLHQNKLSGPIPTALFQLTGLQLLDLGANRLSLEIPQELGRLTGLLSLSLAENLLTGPLIANLSMAKSLVSLRVDGNRLSRSLPWELSALKSLEVFVCADNLFTGSLDVLFSLPSLLSLNASANRFSSTIPGNLGLSQLAYIDASRNSLVGTLPALLGSLSSLKSLSISGNSLSGTYPSELCSLQSLSLVDLSHNRLSGTGPRCISILGNLSSLSLAWNRFTGPLDFLAGAPNLVTVDISGNAFRGSVIDAIFLEKKMLKTFASASNCLSGTISDAVCQATALETLVLDGLNAGSSCRVPIFPVNSVFRFSGSTSLNKIRGKMPDCLLTSLPHISTLHVSGNSLTGNWPNAALVQWPARLVDLSVSHNRLEGKGMSHELQRGLAQFHRFDASFNRFGGELGEVLLTHGGNSTELNYKVNRLSGKLSPSIIAASDVHVLEGNLFECPKGASQLPANDPYASHFRCGSDTLNDYMIVFTVLVVASVAMTWWFLRLNSRVTLQRVTDWLDPVVETVAFAPTSVTTVLSSLRSVRRLAGLFGVLLAVVLLPIYGATSSLQGTHAELYAWVASAIFKSGAGSAAAFLVSWVLLFLAVHWNLATQYATASTAAESSSSQRRKTEPSGHRSLLLQALLSLRLVFIFFLDLFCVLLPNVGYVVVVGSQSSSAQIVTGLALSAFKMLWGCLGLPRLLSSRRLFFGVTETDIEAHSLGAWTGGFVFELLLRGINAVVAPTVALLAIDANCFSEALFSPQPVESSYSFQSASTHISIVVTTYYDGTSMKTRTLSTTVGVEKRLVQYVPAFQYGFQCTASLLRTYTPVFLLMTLISCFGEPLVHYAARFAPKPLSSRGQGQGQDRTTWLAHSVLPMIAKWKPDLPTLQGVGKRRQVLDTHAIFMPLAQDLLILLSFGVVAPLLGIVIVVSLISRTLRWHRFIVDFVSSEEARSSGGIEALAEDCRELSERPHPLFSVRWFLVASSATFLAFFLIDTAGDSAGIKASLWAPLLMLLLPLVLGLLLERRLLLPSASTAPARASAPSVADADTEAAEGSVEMSSVYANDTEDCLDGRNSVAFFAQEARAEDSSDAARHSGALSAAVLQDHIPPRALELLHLQRHHPPATATGTATATVAVQSPLHNAPARLSTSTPTTTDPPAASGASPPPPANPP